jgi:hypothetical protein
MSGRMRGTAEEGNRTPKPLRAEDFESSASASSATSALGKRTRLRRRAPAPELARVPLHVLPLRASEPASRERGSREDPGSLVNLNARVPKHLWRRVRLRCVREERLLRSFITDALREYLRERSGRRTE